mmetsp:Transcript_37934/g.94270  ORF Transcript_37934/g.94270 Transcript_37934/m.94270 type:complete len:285 (-) Transcript_37934:206-1060(-)
MARAPAMLLSSRASSSAFSSTFAWPRSIRSSSSRSRFCMCFSCRSFSAIFSCSSALITSSSFSRYERLRQLWTYKEYCAESSASSRSYSSMKAGRTVCSDWKRFSLRSSSVFFFSILASRLLLSCSTFWRVASICSACSLIASTSRCKCFCRVSISKFLPRARAAASFVSECEPSSLSKCAPYFVMSDDRLRVSFKSANLWPGPMSAGVVSSVSSGSALALRWASWRSEASFRSSRTANPLLAYRFFRLSLMRALTRSSSATDFRKTTRSWTVRVSSRISMFLS